MKFIVSIISLFLTGLLWGQVHDEHIQALIDQYTAQIDVNCDVYIEVDVEGIIVPPKTVNLRFKDGEPQISGEGIAMLPKKGIIDQFNRLLNEQFQAIYLSKRGTKRVYKLVSLEESSDWITADIEFDENTLFITKTTINTRKFGSFKVSNTYKDYMYPSKSVIYFDLKKFKLPIKLLGRVDAKITNPDTEEITEGKVYLTYTYLK
jgi:hypothetical protein